VTEGKKEALVAAGKCKANGLVGNCCIHNTQLTPTVPMQKLFGSGGVGIRKVVQLLYLAYCLQTSIGRRMTQELLKEAREMALFDDNISDKEFD
jgi:hypothetical protein